MKTHKENTRVSRLQSIVIGFLVLIAISCSKDEGFNCQDRRDEINQYYDQKIEYVMNHPGPNGIDYRQIELLNIDRQRELSEACD